MFALKNEIKDVPNELKFHLSEIYIRLGLYDQALDEMLSIKDLNIYEEANRYIDIGAIYLE